MKAELVSRVLGILHDSGFRTSDCSGTRSCFDVLAKKRGILLIKVLGNIEAFSRINAMELANLAELLNAVPLVLGERMKSARLSAGVIYARYDIHVINAETFGDILRDRMPFIHSVRGNYCVRIDSELLGRLRRGLDLTQEELATELGVSKQSIHRYENSGRISVDIANRLMDFLHEEIRVPGSIADEEIHPVAGGILERNLTSLKKTVLREFRNIGLSSQATNAPFDILSLENSHEKRILSIVSDDGRRIGMKVEMLTEASEIIGGYKVCISNRRQDADILIMKPDELAEIKDAEEFVRILARS